MPTRSRSAAWHPHTLALAAFASAVYLVECAVVRSAAFAARPDLLAAAVAADLTLVVPVAYWALVVRRGVASLRSLLPAVALSVLGARLVLPAEHRSFVGLLRYATVPLELALVAYGVRGARRALRSSAGDGAGAGGDTAEALERAFVAAFGDGAVARALAGETAVFCYALRGRRPAAAPAAGAFSQEGARSAALVWGFGLAATTETAALHFWLVRTHPALAWGLVALSAYSVLWLVGHHRATARRPAVVAGDTLVLRAGLRLSARVPVAAVARAEQVSWRTAPPRAPGYLNVAGPAGPNVVLTFREEVAVTGPLGLRRAVARVGLRLDDAAGFAAALRGAGVDDGAA